MAIEVPEHGFIFWPVGTGDSTTVSVGNDVFLQIDLRHMSKSEDEDDTAWPIVDSLIEILPTVDGEPFLSTFALTHPDKDHCQGFEDLNSRVTISEIWASPRTFREYKENEDLCEDAEAFQKEAQRRIKETIDSGGDPGSGNRIRIIGYDELLEEDDYKGLPKEFLSIPGHTITIIDGEDCSDRFEAFVHAPFKDDSYGERNDCSLAFQITLKSGEGLGKALLMGDLKYPIVKRIFDVSDADNLQWNVLLAPHHCSKSVMYWQDEEDKEEVLKKDIVDAIAESSLDISYVISSSEPVPSSNKSGDNPPHAKAKAEYEKIVANDFICTHEHPAEDNPQPIIFEVTEEGFSYLGEEADRKSMKDTLKEAGGTTAPSTTAVGFG